MQIQGGKIPKARQLSRFGCELSRAGQLRLQWMTHYLRNGRSAAFTCRHFGISRQTFYRWRRRYDSHDLTSLEDLSHRPRRLRQRTWTTTQAEAVLAARNVTPAAKRRRAPAPLRTSRTPKRQMQIPRRFAP